MSLIRCENCGKLLSDRASKCPHCGNKKIINNRRKLSNKKTIIIPITFILIITLLFFRYNIFSNSIEDVKNSVVKIEVYDENNEIIASGSGFCLYNDNYIVTNFHVIEGAYSIKVVNDDKKEFKANGILFFDKKDDLAIIKVNGKFEPLKIGISNNLKVKSKITTVGSPMGELNTVSEGIISNIDDKDMIRITAPISHGSSGGVLLNKRNEVIGITNAGYDDAQNLNYAINVNVLKKIYSNYKNKKYDKITSSNYKECAPNIINYNTKNQLSMKNKCNFSNYNIYTVDSLNNFYLATNSYQIFNTAMKKLGIDGFNKKYFKLDSKEQKTASDYYTSLLQYENCDTNSGVSCSVENIDSWNSEQLIMELDVLRTYELAILLVELPKYNSNNIFNYINSLPLGVSEKGILLILYGGYYPSRLTNSNAREIISFINGKNISSKEKKKILNRLGYTINGTNIRW